MSGAGTLWLFNIAMEIPNHKWRFLAGKIIYTWAIYTMAMLGITRLGILTFLSYRSHISHVSV